MTEIYAVKALQFFFIETSYVSSLVISSFLAGIALATLTVQRFERHLGAKEFLVLLIGIFVLYGYFVLKNLNLIPESIDRIHQFTNVPALVLLLKMLLIWIFLLVPAFFLGAGYPLLLSDMASNAPLTPAMSTRLYFWDTFGAILGCLASGFILIPKFGMHQTMLTATAISSLALVLLARLCRRQAYLVFALCICLLVAGVECYQMRKSQNASAPIDIGKILFREQSPFGLIQVAEKGSGAQIDKTLYVNFRSMCVFSSSANQSENQIAKLSGDVLHPGGSVLNIGLGCGMTAGTLARHKNIASVNIIEINPVIVKASKQHFSDANEHVLEHPKVSLQIGDGAAFIRQQTHPLYDGIVIDVEEVSIIYSSPLFTVDYFKKMQTRLKEGGVLAFWSFRVSREFTRVLYNSLRAVFSNVEIKLADNAATYYASNRALDLPAPNAEEVFWLGKVFELKLDAVNTLDNQELLKHFSTNETFGLPTNYDEEFKIK